MADPMPQRRDNRAYAALEARFATAAKLAAARSILSWDSHTMMPPSGAWGRGEQAAALSEAIIDVITSPETAHLIAEARAAPEALDEEEAASLREAERGYAHAAATPKALVGEAARLSQALQAAWAEARRTNAFALFAPGFEALIAVHREVAAAKAEALRLAPYDVFVDEHDPGISTAQIDPLFSELEAKLPAVLAEALEAQARQPAPEPFDGDLSDARQMALSVRLAEQVGHKRGDFRIDLALHPFSVPQTPGDVRFTTRFFPAHPQRGVLATMHEAGHAMYEANLPRRLAFKPAGVARGAAAHESQSLMLEKQAGLSDEFLAFLAPVMAQAFDGSPKAYAPGNVRRAFRRIEPGYIRVEADEISYPLHILLRYRLERALIAGDLAVRDLPGAWNEASQALFGRAPPDDARGCLQDIHWAIGLFGYFPSYSLGAMLAAQLFERASSEDEEILPALARGDFHPYFAWLKPRVHERASLVGFDTLVREATGGPLSAKAYLRHLRRRYLAQT